MSETVLGMKSIRPLLIASVAASLIFLFADSLAAGDWPVVFKLASIAILATLAIRADKLLATALAFGALGDFFLGVRRIGSLDAEKLFLFGLGAFLLGHLVYIALFVRLRQRQWRHRPAQELAVTAILICLAIVLLQLQHALGPLLVPVVVYALVLATMAICAQFADLGTPLVAIGALCFVASDAMLAIARFRGPFSFSFELIWISYYLAQLLIALGVLRYFLARRPA